MKYKNLKLKGYIHHRKVYKPHFRKLNMENEKQNENENELTLIKEMGLNLNRINRNKEVLKKHNRVFVNGYINKNMTKYKGFTIEEKNQEFWIRDSEKTLIRIFKTKEESISFIDKRRESQGKGKSIFSKDIIKELNKISKKELI